MTAQQGQSQPSPQRPAPLIEARDLTVRYAHVPVLTGVSLSVAPAEIVTVVGPNGSGKSTLIRALLGILKPTSGAVIRKPGLRIGYVPQRLAIEPTMPISVARFLSLPEWQDRAAIAAALDRVGMSGLQREQMNVLSGGQFQRVLLARALLGRPDILILDEPTQGLDPPGIGEFYMLIEELRRDTGCAVLLVSHDLHVVMRASDRVICLNGHVCCQGTPGAVLQTPEYRALFGQGAEALALYSHDHDHRHDHDHSHGHEG